MKTNAARLLDRLGVSYEPRELEGGAGGDGARDAAASDAQDAAAGSLAP
jgi:hypothetical protein